MCGPTRVAWLLILAMCLSVEAGEERKDPFKKALREKFPAVVVAPPHPDPICAVYRMS